MWALFEDFAVFEDHDAVGGGGLGKSVCHNESATSVGCCCRCRLQVSGTGASGFGGRFVEHGDGGVGEDESRKCQLL